MMISPPIKVKHKVYSQSAVPLIVWVLIVIAFAGGYFVGGTMQAIAFKNDADRAAHYIGGK